MSRRHDQPRGIKSHDAISQGKCRALCSFSIVACLSFSKVKPSSNAPFVLSIKMADQVHPYPFSGLLDYSPLTQIEKAFQQQHLFQNAKVRGTRVWFIG